MLLPKGKWRCPRTGTVYAKRPPEKFEWNIDLSKGCRRWSEDIECRIFVRVMGASSYETIAKACGMSKEYVEAVEARALEKLRRRNVMIDFAGQNLEVQGCSLDIV